MLKKTVLNAPILALIMASGAGFAQNQEAPKAPETPKYYKLEFVVKEVEGGKVLNSRAYSTMVAATGRENQASIRVGSRVPYEAGGVPPNVQYLDIGMNTDCRNVNEVEGGLSLWVSADISSVPSDAEFAGGHPTIRQNRWSSSAIVPLNKPTLLYSSDDPASKRQMQLELTATPIP